MRLISISGGIEMDSGRSSKQMDCEGDLIVG